MPNDSYFRYKAEDLSYQAKKKFLADFQALAEELYLKLKKGKLGKEQKGFIDGYMAAGIQMRVVSSDDLQEALDKAHREIFGKSYEERQAILKSLKLPEEELDIPTFERLGKIVDKE